MTALRGYGAGGGPGGFALPVVVVLTVIGSLLVAMMVDRLAGQQRAVLRQVNRYHEHHTARGVPEVLSGYLTAVQGQRLEDVLGPDGRAFTLKMEGGRSLSVLLTDGQGPILLDPEQADSEVRADLRRVLEALAEAVGPERVPELGRTAGPAAVSAATAPEEVLAAIAGVFLEPRDVDRFVRSVVEARARGELSRGELSRLVSAAGIQPAERSRLDRLLTGEPSLWRVSAELRGRAPGEFGEVLLEEGGGLVPIQRRRGGGRAGRAETSFQPEGRFLTWEWRVVRRSRER